MKPDKEINWDAIEPARSRLRALVAAVAREVQSVDGQAQGGAATSLSFAWTSLVAELDLGAEPTLRECPHCGRAILRRAVRCRYCMKRSPGAEP